MQLERQALFWTAIALLFAYLVELLAPVLLPFVLGLTLAYFFNPIVDLLGRIGLPAGRRPFFCSPFRHALS